MSVKATYLKVVTDLSNQAFLAALDRFVAKRGIPTDIFSACGTNYVGVAQHLKEFFNDIDTQQLVANQIPYTFNPLAAPHFGGLWVARIKSAKFLLKHAIEN